MLPLMTLPRIKMTWPDDVWLQCLPPSLASNNLPRWELCRTCPPPPDKQQHDVITFLRLVCFQTPPGGTCKTFCQGNLVARPLLFWSRPHMWNMPCDSNHNDINNHIDDDGAQVVGQWVILNWLLTFYYIAWTPESPMQGVEQGGWLVKCLMNVHVCTFVHLYVNVSLCARGYICVHLCVFPCDCFCVDCDIAD